MTEHLNGRLQLSVAQKSEKGRKEQNEDCIGIRLPEGSSLINKGALAVIADGVSAAEAGQEASHTAVQGILNDYYSTPDSWQTKTSANRVIAALNRWLYQQSHHQLGTDRGFVCTLSALVLKSRVGYVFHIGDTRIYRLRDGNLEPLTRDHVTSISKGKTYLARALGMDLNLDIDYRTVDLEVGDIFLLTSDGIHDYLRSRDIEKIVADNSHQLDRAVELLIEQASANDSPDNLSCQLVRVDSLPQDDANDVYTKLTQLPFAPYLSTGLTIDGLKIVRELSSSNRSEVFVVTDEANNNNYVMKVASQNFDDDPAYIERFVMEEWIGKRIQNSHIIKVLDPPYQRSCLYYLTEHVRGLSLAEWITQNPKPSVQQVLPIIKQLCKAATALHRLETLHQDIKPDNVLLDEHGEVKLIDFGSCRIGGLNEIQAPIERQYALGTAHFSAPEYKLNRRPTQASDYFSIGVVCYKMLCGQLPFGEKYANAPSSKELYRLKYTPVYQHNPLVPRWIDCAIKKLVNLNPEARYEALSEFIFDLEKPNPRFTGAEFTPFIKRNPIRFWQIVAASSLFINFIFIYLLLAT